MTHDTELLNYFHVIHFKFSKNISPWEIFIFNLLSYKFVFFLCIIFNCLFLPLIILLLWCKKTAVFSPLTSWWPIRVRERNTTLRCHAHLPIFDLYTQTHTLKKWLCTSLSVKIKASLLCVCFMDLSEFLTFREQMVSRSSRSETCLSNLINRGRCVCSACLMVICFTLTLVSLWSGWDLCPHHFLWILPRFLHHVVSERSSAPLWSYGYINQHLIIYSSLKPYHTSHGFSAGVAAMTLMTFDPSAWVLSCNLRGWETQQNL